MQFDLCPAILDASMYPYITGGFLVFQYPDIGEGLLVVASYDMCD